MSPRNIQITRLAPDDWERYKTLRLAALAESPDAFWTRLFQEEDQPESFWRGRLATATATISAQLDGNDVGLMAVAPWENSTTQAGIFSVWVAPGARGHGIGRAMTRDGISAAREAGFQRVILEVADHNTAAIALYEAMGFEPTGRAGALPAPRSHITEHERALTL